MKPSNSQVRRVPNGAAFPRIQVALPDETLLKDFLADARRNMRSLSAHAAWIIAQHYRNTQS